MTNKKGKSGRKPYSNPLDKKVRVEFWVKAKTIETLGGKDKVRALAVKAWERNESQIRSVCSLGGHQSAKLIWSVRFTHRTQNTNQL